MPSRTRTEGQPQPAREYPRAPFGVEVRFYEWDKAHVARGHEIGGGGLFLETTAPIPEGTRLTLRVTLPAGAAFTVLGEVVRTVRGGPMRKPGLGVRFLDLAARDRDAILDYVARHSVRAA